jgi:hypothetical protein
LAPSGDDPSVKITSHQQLINLSPAQARAAFDTMTRLETEVMTLKAALADVVEQRDSAVQNATVAVKPKASTASLRRVWRDIERGRDIRRSKKELAQWYARRETQIKRLTALGLVEPHDADTRVLWARGQCPDPDQT